MTQIKEELTQKQNELEEMMKAGVHLGHKKNKKHPKMEPYIYGIKNGVNIIDVEKTQVKIEETISFIKNLLSQEKTIMVVGTKVQLQEAVKNFAIESELPYITNRWLGGTFTNFENIKKRVDHLKDLEKKRDEGELDKYTKKEKLDILREIDSLKEKFEGLKNLSKVPDAVIITDMEKDFLAIKEARNRGVKIIAIVDTNVDPELVDFPIPANDDALASVNYILEKLKSAFSETKILNAKN